jgi:hypothetical protein
MCRSAAVRICYDPLPIRYWLPMVMEISSRMPFRSIAGDLLTISYRTVGKSSDTFCHADRQVVRRKCIGFESGSFTPMSLMYFLARFLSLRGAFTASVWTFRITGRLLEMGLTWGQFQTRNRICIASLLRLANLTNNDSRANEHRTKHRATNCQRLSGFVLACRFSKSAASTENGSLPTF